MKDDKYYVELLESYRSNTNEDWQDIAKRLNVTPNTIINWRNGGRIANKNRNGIAVLAERFSDYEKRHCFLEKCPAEPPPDRFLQVVLESWNGLEVEDRAQIAALAARLLEKSGSNPLDCDMASNRKAN